MSVMVEILEVKDWDSISVGKFPSAHDYLWIRLAEQSAILEIADALGLAFVFKKGNELLCD